MIQIAAVYIFPTALGLGWPACSFAWENWFGYRFYSIGVFWVRAHCVFPPAIGCGLFQSSSPNICHPITSWNIKNLFNFSRKWFTCHVARGRSKNVASFSNFGGKGRATSKTEKWKGIGERQQVSPNGGNCKKNSRFAWLKVHKC